MKLVFVAGLVTGDFINSCSKQAFFFDDTLSSSSIFVY